MTSHMLILPLVDLYATACDWWVAGLRQPPPGLYWFLVVSYLNGLVIEIGRKTRAPADEEHGVETYSALWGTNGAVRAWLLTVLVTAFAAWRAAGAHRHRSADAGAARGARGRLCRRRRSGRSPGHARKRKVDRADVRRLDRVDVPRSRRRAAGVQTVAVSGWILGSAEAVDSPHAGGKARALARAERAGLPVPAWFALSAEAFVESLDAGTADRARNRHRRRRPRPRARHRFAGARHRRRGIRGGPAPLARRRARSRPIVGQRRGRHRAFVCRSARELPQCAARPGPEKVRAVWQSGFTDRILAYRREHGLPLLPHAPAVLIQRMVSPRAAGVAFGADPVSGRRGVAVVSAVPGFGSAVVSGEADADTWLVDRAGRIVERRIVTKHRMHVADAASPGGVRIADVPASLADQPSLADADVQEVAALARAAGRHFGSPQDIEWAIADRLLLLQSRPITSMRAMADPDASLTIWDNSNIVESYSGVTTPLTFSFAREIYENVYRQFCRMMAVPERVDRRTGGDLPEHARPGSRPAVLQPLELVSRARHAAGLPGEPAVHGTDDGREGAAAGRPGRRDRERDQSGPCARRVVCDPHGRRAGRAIT